MTRRTFSHEFKLDSANLIINQGYSYREAQDATGASNGSLRKWVDQVKKEQQGVTPQSSKAITDDQQKVQRLEARIKRLELEKEILKKATALLMTDGNQFSR